MHIDLKEMLKAGVHFGHRTSRWCPKMRPFIWGSKNHVHLIDVSKTAFLLERAGNVLKNLASEGGTFLFVGTKKAAQDIVKKVATDLQMPYLVNRWLGGTLTNFDQVKKAILRYLHLCDVVKKPTAHLKKKEISTIQKEIERLEKNIGGIVDLSFPPAALVVVDAQKEYSAIKEAINLGIPVIALVDTNTDPEGINFVIPSNDDSPRAIRYIMDYLQARIQEGKIIAADNKVKRAELAAASPETASASEQNVSSVNHEGSDHRAREHQDRPQRPKQGMKPSRPTSSPRRNPARDHNK